MAKTFQNLLDEARAILQDDDGDRYTDAVMLPKLNRALQELARLRPDAFWSYFLTDDIVVPEVVAVDSDPDDEPDEVSATEDGEIALTAAFTLPRQFYTPIVYFLVGSAELIDDEWASDGRAVTLMQKFKAEVISL